MHLVQNKRRQGAKLASGAPFPSTQQESVAALLTQCPAARETPLRVVEGLVPVAGLWVKDERGRMNLGSFKALGAAYVIARHAAEANGTPDENTLKGRTYVTASAGNHGMSVAAGARVFGARAVVYIAETVPATFAERLADKGAEVVRHGADYAASMAEAARVAQAQKWTLLSDSSWAGYTELPHLLMEGYLKLAAEAVAQCPDVPTHILLQAGVGGLAGAAAAYFRKAWGAAPRITVVEPESAPALQASISAGHSVFADGPDSIMGRLDCKEPSLIALNGLARDADDFLTLDDNDVAAQMLTLSKAGLATTPSGGAGLAAVLLSNVRAALDIGPKARILCILSEAAE